MLDAEAAGALADVLAEKRARILPSWLGIVAERLRGRMTPPELERELTPLFDALVSSLGERARSGADPISAELRAMLAEMSRNRARQGFSPSETAGALFALRAAAGPALGEAAVDVAAMQLVVDELGMLSFESFVRAREQVIVDQAEQLLELSTPVVKLWDGVLAVPLVGTLDSARTQVVMEKLLQGLVDTGSEHAIIDITGVAAVDTQVAQHLLKTVVAARLMGAECVISGIRPQIAQTIVALGIQFGDIVTKASLSDALLLALRRRGLEVVRTSPRAG